MEAEGEGEGVRIFMGGLGEKVSSDDLRKMLEPLGRVDSLQFIRTKGRSLAYFDFFPTSPKSLSKLFSTYNGCVWKGGRLRLEKAKEHYLVRLKREWAQDTLVSTSDATTITTTDVDDKQELLTEKMPLRIFFPKLRKLKPIPFAGSGKHKYSFRRVEVPSLRTHFCDCEEHSPPDANATCERFPVPEQLDGGINVKEVDMMNSVMNELLGSQDAAPTAPQNQMTNQAHATTAAIHNKPQLDQNQEDSTSDEDNLITNFVTRSKGTLTAHQDSGFNKRNSSNFLQTQGSLKKQRRNASSPISQSNSVHHQENSTPGLQGTSNAPSDAPEIPPRAQLIQPNSGLTQSTTSFSWSQKSSWRKLVGDDTRFTASQNLPGILPDLITDDVPNSPHSDSVPDLREQSIPDNVPNSPHSDSKLLRNENLKEQLNEAAVEEEGVAEVQPAKPDFSLNDAGRGSAWLQKSSWTQLVGGNNSGSFSITQILPGIAFEEQEPANQRVEVYNFTDSKHGDMVEGHKNISEPNTATQMRLGTGAPVQNAKKMSKQIFVASDATSASVTDKEHRAAALEMRKKDVAIGVSCSFMRTSASLKEWAHAKAAISGSRKRTSNEK